MTWKTHKEGINTSSIILLPIAIYMLGQSELPQAEYTIALISTAALIAFFTRLGTIFPDLDHHNIPQKSWLTTFIHNTLYFIFRDGIKHRSWQTHSIDIYLILMLPSYFMLEKWHETANLIYFQGAMMILAFGTGAIVHLLMDLMTTDGCYLSIILIYLRNFGNKKFKVKKWKTSFAPTNLKTVVITRKNKRGKKTLLPKLRIEPVFKDGCSTDSPYELWFGNMMRTLNIVLLFTSVLLYIYFSLPESYRTPPVA